ncbi:MAG TPA: hypothetical protein VFS46_00490 [Nitrososphaera sp.]|nr:hypothetical protein [Nitrososphaera sp.]
MKDKPSEKQAGPQTKEEDKPNLEDYQSGVEASKRGTKLKEVSDVED